MSARTVVTGYGETTEVPAAAPAWVDAELAQSTDPDNAAVRIWDHALADTGGDVQAAVSAASSWLPLSA